MPDLDVLEARIEELEEEVRYLAEDREKLRERNVDLEFRLENSEEERGNLEIKATRDQVTIDRFRSLIQEFEAKAQQKADSLEKLWVILDDPPKQPRIRFLGVEDASGCDVEVGWVEGEEGFWRLGPFFRCPEEPPASDTPLKFLPEPPATCPHKTIVPTGDGYGRCTECGDSTFPMEQDADRRRFEVECAAITGYIAKGDEDHFGAIIKNAERFADWWVEHKQKKGDEE